MNIRPITLVKALLDRRKSGKPRRGMSTGLLSIDEYLLLNKKYLMVLTGYPSYGKSTFLDSLAINTALLHDWNWLFYSTENDDYSTHLGKLVAYKVGKPIHACTEEEIKFAATWSDRHFSWLDAGEEFYSLDDVLEQTAIKIESGEKVDVLVIDPWNELNHAKQTGRDDVYVSNSMSKVTKFAKKYDILPVIVTHPHSMEKNKDGNHPIPHLRDCAGGAMWWNKAGLGICVHRKDFSVQGMHVYVQKAKDETIGQQGQTFVDYQPGSGRLKDQFSPTFIIPEQLPFDVEGP
jgi:twinkle protein